jgi:alginate O-acetyltransferase complex protein AlgI
VGMGPITQFNAFNKQLNTPKEFELNRIVTGMKRVVIGSFKKIVIADGLATFVGTCFDYPADQRTIFLAWMGGLCFILQEYNDFSGYSDVAIGTGMIFGYSCEENFNYPFASRSISEFWRRWHISLGAWLKTYIYLPLVIKFIKIKNPLTGKKLSPQAGDMLSLFVTWFICGAWHGRGPKYILWGMYFFVFLAIEHIVMFKNKKKAKALQATSKKRLPVLNSLGGHVYAILAILVGEILFRASSLSAFGSYIKNMVGIGNAGLVDTYNLIEFKNYEILFVLSIVTAFPIIKSMYNSKLAKKNMVMREIVTDLFLLGLFCVDIAFAFINTYSAYIYNQF